MFDYRADRADRATRAASDPPLNNAEPTPAKNSATSATAKLGTASNSRRGKR
jgi:hypothetical protein